MTSIQKLLVMTSLALLVVLIPMTDAAPLMMEGS